MKSILARLLLLLPALLSATESARPVSLAGPTSARAWQRLEFRLEGVPLVANPYDPDQIRLDALVVAPSGRQLRVPAFWMEEHTSRLVNGEEQVSATGVAGWRLRFTAEEVGDHALTLELSLAGAPATAVTDHRFAVAPAAPGARTGWVRVAEDRRSLATSDGRALRLIGSNVCWPQRGGTFDFARWFDAMQASGQNVARLWMCPWWLALEQSPDSLNRYKQDQAWRLDRLFELAGDRGLYLLLSLDFHGMFQVDNPHWGGSGNWWPRSPYHRDNGGPGVHPNDFFTDPRAHVLYQKRLRYLIARYGAETHLLAWQFFNEVDNAYAPHLLQAADVAAWHGLMGRWLKEHDPYGHLVTTSLTGGSDRPEIWSLPEMDIAVYHAYGDPAPAKSFARRAEDYHRRYGKPALIGEYGTDWRGWGGRTTDPHLRAQRQALWGSALGGSVGTALSWWWEEMHQDHVYPLYDALARILTAGGWGEGSWRPARVTPASEPPPTRVEAAVPDGEVFSGRLTLNNVTWLDLTGEVALTGALAAERANESLSNYLGGAAQGARRRPLVLDAIWASDAHVKIRVGEVGGPAALAASIDGVPTWSAPLEVIGGAGGRGGRVDREFTIPVPAGRHRFALENSGEQWLHLDWVAVQGVRESSFAGDWRFRTEAVALRRDDRAIVYAVAPWAVYGASANRYRPPAVRGETLALEDWPDGEYEVRWYRPSDGRETRRDRVRAAGGRLPLELPEFAEDLAAVVQSLHPAAGAP